MTLRQLLTIILATIFSVAVYLAASILTYRSGYPLDDAWIHQTYARNLALFGEWAFIQGAPSGGSTAPLWTFLLSLGTFVIPHPLVWGYLWGIVCLIGIGCLGIVAAKIYLPEHSHAGIALGFFLIFEYHLVWASVSGMETLLSGFLITLVLLLIVKYQPNWLWVGLLVGLGIWVRPDCLTLAGPVAIVLLSEKRPENKRIHALARFLVGFGLLFLPYLGFNYWIAGSVWPSTYYAKQAEYAILLEKPMLIRFLEIAWLPLIGVGSLLLPGFLAFFWKHFTRRDWSSLAVCLWFLGFIGMYAMKLPVTYQHGRYIMPAMPIYFILSLVGMYEFSRGIQLKRVGWVLLKTWQISVPAVLVVFWLLGARAYSLDVAIIESEMVVTALWLRENTPPGSRLAVHDIGAIGYYADRPLVDLAGLITPEVIPFIRDEIELGKFINTQQAAYLVTFPGWYPDMIACGEELFTTNASYAPFQGGENMVVYRWISGCTLNSVR